MLLNVKPTVYAALSGDATLVAMLTGGIYADACPDAGTYPVLVYSEISNIPALHADDAEKASKSTIQIGILTNGSSTSAIAARVDTLMLGLGFMRQFAGDLQDGLIKIKTMRYCISQ